MLGLIDQVELKVYVVFVYPTQPSSLLLFYGFFKNA
jgi:hypothetical protein